MKPFVKFLGRYWPAAATAAAALWLAINWAAAWAWAVAFAVVEPETELGSKTLLLLEAADKCVESPLREGEVKWLLVLESEVCCCCCTISCETAEEWTCLSSEFSKFKISDIWKPEDLCDEGTLASNKLEVERKKGKGIG